MYKLKLPYFTLFVVLIIYLTLFPVVESEIVLEAERPAAFSLLNEYTTSKDNNDRSTAGFQSVFNAGMPDPSKYPLDIVKSFDPIKENGYLIDKDLKVQVEIRCLTNETRTIHILENVGDNFEIVNDSYCCYTIHDMSEIINSKRCRFEKNNANSTNNNIYNINHTNHGNMLNITLDKGLKKNERAIYWYYIKPRKKGTFKTETFIRIDNYNDKFKPRFDVDIPTYIKVVDTNPEFNVKMKLNNLKANFDEDIEIVYYIKYIKGYQDDLRCHIEIDPEKNYNIIDRANSSFYFNFSLNNSKNSKFIPIKLRFDNNKTPTNLNEMLYSVIKIRHEVHSLPVVRIACENYTFSETIVVDTPIYRYSNVYAILISIGALFLSIGSILLTTYYTRKEIRELGKLISYKFGEPYTPATSYKYTPILIDNKLYRLIAIYIKLKFLLFYNHLKYCGLIRVVVNVYQKQISNIKQKLISSIYNLSLRRK